MRIERLGRQGTENDVLIGPWGSRNRKGVGQLGREPIGITRLLGLDPDGTGRSPVDDGHGVAGNRRPGRVVTLEANGQS